MSNKKKVLLIRLDKIGDLVCTLPTDQVLDENQFDVTWVIQKGLSSLVERCEKNRSYIELNKKNRTTSQIFLRRYLKENCFDYAISFQCPWWVNYELFLAGIPNRIGVLSQWHSFLFLNKGLRQKRSQALKHEFAYNLELVQKITGPIPIDKIGQIVLRLKKPITTATLDQYNLKTYWVIHPGMMGSALNWPQENYINFIQHLINNEEKVVITGTAADDPYLFHIKLTYKDHPQVLWLQDKLNFDQLIEVLYYAKSIVAPSTGVTHLAASLGKDIKAIYSPIRVHHPRRWGPRPITAAQDIKVYLPNVDCPAEKKCLLDQCPNYNCMKKIQL